MFKFLLTKLKTNEFYNIKHLLFSYALKYLVGLFINIWIVRALGNENYGVFAYVNSVSGIFGIFSTFGLQAVVVTLLINSDENKQKKIIHNAFIISFITGVIAGLSQFFFVLYFNYNENIVIILCLINIIIYFFDTFKVLTFYFESKVQSAKIAKINNISLIICTLFRIGILYFHLNIYYIAFSYVLDFIIVAILLYKIFPKSIFILNNIKIDKIIFSSLIKNSLPYLFSGLFINFFMKIDLIMIKNILNNNDAGIFAASIRLTEIWYFIPGIIQTTFFPNLVQNKNNNTYNDKIITLYKLMIIFSLFVIIATILFGKILVIKLFGIEFKNAYYPLIIHIWCLLFVSISVIRNSSLFAHNYSKIFFRITMAGAICNLFLCYLLINLFGIIGASIATLISYFIVAYVSNYFFKELHDEAKNINFAAINIFNFRKIG
jgi:O-antigen/teichoic acid export membrane protein